MNNLLKENIIDELKEKVKKLEKKNLDLQEKLNNQKTEIKDLFSYNLSLENLLRKYEKGRELFSGLSIILFLIGATLIVMDYIILSYKIA